MKLDGLFWSSSIHPQNTSSPIYTYILELQKYPCSFNLSIPILSGTPFEHASYFRFARSRHPEFAAQHEGRRHAKKSVVAAPLSDPAAVTEARVNMESDFLRTSE